MDNINLRETDENNWEYLLRVEDDEDVPKIRNLL